MHSFFEEKHYLKVESLEKGVFERCVFENCNFSEQDVSGSKFSDCSFIACNLSLMSMNLTSFQQVSFVDCKMLGLRFDFCNPFGFSISTERCQLMHSSFFKLNLKKTNFIETDLSQVDFTESNLTEAKFVACNLYQALFSQTMLEKADLRTAVNFSIDPEQNRIKKARFSIEGLQGLLHKYDLQVEG
jgi:uncharacterized protein YjbI with pentapeptide repeats